MTNDRARPRTQKSVLAPVIWITRTSPENERTAGALRLLGYDALCEPVLRVDGLPPTASDGKPDALVFTSVNGVRHHPLRRDLCDLPVFAVGDRTAESAARVGYSKVISAAGDVRDLERQIVRALLPGSRLLHYAALRPAGDLTGNLNRKGYLAERIPVYRTCDVSASYLLSNLAQHRLDEISGICVHSPRGGRVVRRCLERMSRTFDGIVYCISETAADVFSDMQELDVRVAARPDEVSMLALIESFIETSKWSERFA